VLILLPPSEAKVPGGTGPSLTDLGLLTSADALDVARRRVVTAAARMSGRNTARVRAVLKLPPGSAVADLADNVAMLTAPTMPALERFSGVLFAALDVTSLTARARRNAGDGVLVFSGAFGVLAADDLVPMHRVPASATLPRVGPVATLWRRALAGPMSARLADSELVVDLRSSDYAAMWRPTSAEQAKVLPVRVLEQRGDQLRPVSWSAKHGKGLLARELLRFHSARTPVETWEQVSAAAERIGYRAIPRQGPTGWALDLVVPPAQ
jgi:cytoplasmic iron level regulating protein YaaA (DUF328/UPF0246 family)